MQLSPKPPRALSRMTLDARAAALALLLSAVSLVGAASPPAEVIRDRATESAPKRGQEVAPESASGDEPWYEEWLPAPRPPAAPPPPEVKETATHRVERFHSPNGYTQLEVVAPEGSEVIVYQGELGLSEATVEADAPVRFRVRPGRSYRLEVRREDGATWEGSAAVEVGKTARFTVTRFRAAPPPIQLQ